MWITLNSIIGLVVLVCWIMEVVVAFKKGDGPLLGILSIVCCCTLGGLVIGWIKCKEWGIQTLMVVYTIAFILNFITGFMAQAEWMAMFQVDGLNGGE